MLDCSETHVGGENSSARQIRGSSLLLAGRGVSLFLNFLTQIITIRYLLKQDYGAFAYAISVVELASLATAFALDKTFARFGAVYHESGNLRRLNGALLLSAGVILGLGGLFAGGYWLGRGFLADGFQLTTSADAALFWLVLLIPAGAFGSLASSFFAVMGETRTVFFRRHLIGPGLKCIALVFAIVFRGGLEAVVIAFAIAGLLQFALDLGLTARFARKYRLLESIQRERPEFPVREIFGFCLPLLASDGVTMVSGPLVVVCLSWMSGTLASAGFRAVLPVIRLSELPSVTFAILFVPMASRLLTRNRHGELRQMYLRTRTWIRVLTFPIFAVCVLLAEPVIQVLFGSEYLDSAPLLAILAVGYYFEASLGFNIQVLKVLEKMRLVVCTEIAGTLITTALCLLLISKYQALGAAMGVGLGMILHNLLREAVAQRAYPTGTGWNHLAAADLTTFACVGLAVSIRVLLHPGFAWGFAMALVLSLGVFLVNRTRLDIAAMFPEVGRFPVLRRFLSGVGS